jgi:hypothetical protein
MAEETLTEICPSVSPQRKHGPLNDAPTHLVWNGDFGGQRDIRATQYAPPGVRRRDQE